LLLIFLGAALPGWHGGWWIAGASPHELRSWRKKHGARTVAAGETRRHSGREWKSARDEHPGEDGLGNPH